MKRFKPMTAPYNMFLRCPTVGWGLHSAINLEPGIPNQVRGKPNGPLHTFLSARKNPVQIPYHTKNCMRKKLCAQVHCCLHQRHLVITH